MTVAEFFKDHHVVIWTLEYLKAMMTDAFPELEVDYLFDKPKITECAQVADKQDMFPVVLLELTMRSDPQQKDFLYFIPETGEISNWPGKLEYREVTPTDIGKRFNLKVKDGTIEGKIIMRERSFCFQFKHDYNHGKKSDG